MASRIRSEAAAHVGQGVRFARHLCPVLVAMPCPMTECIRTRTEIGPLDPDGRARGAGAVRCRPRDCRPASGLGRHPPERVPPRRPRAFWQSITDCAQAAGPVLSWRAAYWTAGPYCWRRPPAPPTSEDGRPASGSGRSTRLGESGPGLTPGERMQHGLVAEQVRAAATSTSSTMASAASGTRHGASTLSARSSRCTVSSTQLPAQVRPRASRCRFGLPVQARTPGSPPSCSSPADHSEALRRRTASGAV